MSATTSVIDTKQTTETNLVLVDGDCALCHGLTRFVTKRDPNAHFRFAALQSAAGQRLLEAGGLSTYDLKTLVLIANGRYYTKSGAALRIFRKLGGGWSWFYGAIVVPRILRDWVYDRIAANRYKLFGKVEPACPLPTAEMRERTISDEYE
ncbi:thiol-disulfide oxidoreductase DCC family protein [Paenibacillus sp. NEAU-GSW1]|uniref:thiol-disulfide oxidoreductase DCC family protein n=1 Tax=Paenibacillus sp. NEAU-GSW1 TaxID=2682486 RepID=UPI0012E1158D|nr:DCC1-like thiol-disulfide oxidoreductase family protein [Paenibacillus sp. NEAU-GSW1]MUT67006.1 DUF393 domain-containing protein [Paenibacillus sp. NEAU-GSW1]